jgi:small subunit ribosomal protein S20
MAQHKSAKKRIRQNAKRRTKNRYYGKTTRNLIKKVRTATTKADGDSALPKTASEIDKLAKRNIIHKNKAANLKRKLAKRVSKLS